MFNYKNYDHDNFDVYESGVSDIEKKTRALNNQFFSKINSVNHWLNMDLHQFVKLSKTVITFIYTNKSFYQEINPFLKKNSNESFAK